VLAGAGTVVGRETPVDLDQPSGRARRYVDFVYQPVPDEAGGVGGVLVHAVDVTDHVRTRRAVEEAAAGLSIAEERYRRLFETLPSGVVYQDASGRIVSANPAAAELLGVDRDLMLGRDSEAAEWRAVREDGTPFPGEDHPAMVSLRTGSTVPGVVMGVAHGRTGERRWLSVTAVPDAFDEAGVPQRVYTIVTDVTDQRVAEAALAQSERLLTRLRDSNTLAIVLADEASIYDANDVMLEMIGHTRADLDAGRISWRDFTPPEYAAADDDGLAQLRATGICQPFEKEFVRRDGRRVPVLLGAAAISTDPLRWVTYIIDLSAQRRAEAERAAAAERERAARASAAAAQEQVAFLLRAGGLLAATRDRDELLRQAAELVLPAFGDWSVVFAPGRDGVLRSVAVAHRDPERAGVAAQLIGSVLPAAEPLAVRHAYRTATTQLVRDVLPGPGLWQADIAEQLAAHGLHPDSMVAAPLVSATRTLGVLAVVRGTEREPFTDDDAALVRGLARQLALGLHNAELSAREHTVAETLQRAVLPAELPVVEGVDLAAVYLPATEGIMVGGDFHDAFPVGPGLLGVVVGDVVGHDITAASVMGQLRNGLRTVAALHRDPETVLADTQRALVRLLPDALATVFYGVLDVASGELVYANAGHPPAVVSNHTGVRFLDDVSGPMLGADPEAAFGAGRTRLEPGSTLVMFTDGLVEERDRPVDVGLDQLRRTLVAAGDGDPSAVCELLTGALLGDRGRSDDVCILAVRLASHG
jgi:PAS domain S-box-containing protein